jgi:hypothetical protein
MIFSLQLFKSLILKAAELISVGTKIVLGGNECRKFILSSYGCAAEIGETAIAEMVAPVECGVLLLSVEDLNTLLLRWDQSFLCATDASVKARIGCEDAPTAMAFTTLSAVTGPNRGPTLLWKPSFHPSNI